MAEMVVIDRGRVQRLRATPWIHIHYLESDAEAEKRGWTQIEIVCHGCSEARHILFDMPPPGTVTGRNESVGREREAFQTAHAEHGQIDRRHHFMCPPARSRQTAVDLREASRGR